MAKKVAVLAVNPVNGCGLFQYLEAFFENGISYKVFAVSDTKEIKTNSGMVLIVDDVIANLKGHEDEFDALVFSCGDAVPVFQQYANQPYNVDLMEVIKTFGEKVQSPNQKIPDRKTKCVIKTHINIKQNVIFGAKLKPV